MDNEMIIVDDYDLFLYLDDIVTYVDSILFYHNGNYDSDLDEILMYLSSIEEIVEEIKKYLYEKL